MFNKIDWYYIYNCCKEVYNDIYHETKERVFTDNITPVTQYIKQHSYKKKFENIDENWELLSTTNKRKCIVCEKYYDKDVIHGVCCSEYCKNIYLDNDRKIEKEKLLIVGCPICGKKHKIYQEEIKNIDKKCECKEKKVRWNV
ncbi:Hypothetical protein ORPV_128 [Orpheovirus IHUMI-LCC2]|uniref:Uncharacterized protein n=1 Tax=Orpheovirus IHUMI-LCC2 TaxID=2023057 RepID=A0A2I2L3B6_9VIRU|nr:Hypothetical protein ORPV_128 [Orpheovirus IHUMI-LCC2]SNW62032.1 Hypothetical protein ORPV_128 [Orpheovirus IHUMI-LCC2]